MNKNKLYYGDCLQVMNNMMPCSVERKSSYGRINRFRKFIR